MSADKGTIVQGNSRSKALEGGPYLAFKAEEEGQYGWGRSETHSKDELTEGRDRKSQPGPEVRPPDSLPRAPSKARHACAQMPRARR